MTVERRSRRFSSDRLERLARRLMNASTLCALATAWPGGRPHINHTYFAWTGDFDIVWISDPDSRHSRNLSTNRSAAITIYDSHQTWGGFDRGMQLFGTAYPFYRFRPREVKLFHERILGGGTLVTAKVDGERLAWARPITTARRSQRRPTTQRAPIPPFTSISKRAPALPPPTATRAT